jgi:hypothetical protein
MLPHIITIEERKTKENSTWQDQTTCHNCSKYHMDGWVFHLKIFPKEGNFQYTETCRDTYICTECTHIQKIADIILEDLKEFAAKQCGFPEYPPD